MAAVGGQEQIIAGNERLLGLAMDLEFGFAAEQDDPLVGFLVVPEVGR